MSAHNPTDPAAGTAADAILAFLQNARNNVPAEVRHAAARVLLNGLRAVVSSMNEPLPVTMLARRPASSDDASVLFKGHRLSVEDASFFNQLHWTYQLLDDVELQSGLHPGGAAVTAALAVAERRERAGHPVSGHVLLNAIVVGIELQIAVALAAAPEIRSDRGFAPLSVMAPLGAVAAGIMVDDPDADTARHAIGMAGMSGIGMWEMGGTSSAYYLTARSAQSGLAALEAAKAGFTAPALALDGPFGAFRAYCGKPSEVLLQSLQKLGQTWWTQEVFFQPYSGDTYTQAPLAAIKAIRSRMLSGGALPEVERIKAYVCERAAVGIVAKIERFPQVDNDLTFNSDPSSRLAAAWLHGIYSMEQDFSEAIANPEVADLRQRVDFIGDPAISGFAPARVEVFFKDGSRESEDVAAFAGSKEQPFTDDALGDLFRSAAGGSLTSVRMERIISSVWGLEDASSIAPLTAELSGPPLSAKR